MGNLSHTLSPNIRDHHGRRGREILKSQRPWRKEANNFLDMTGSQHSGANRSCGGLHSDVPTGKRKRFH